MSLERLEPRWLFAQASIIAHAFRQDDFSITGGFTYRLHEPPEFDYIDTVDNGQFTGSGRLTWTGPTTASGSFNGTASGDGRDTVNFAGRRPCSEYGFEERGGFQFNLNGSQLEVRQVPIDTSRYTYYRDLTGGFCPATIPPWFRFFTGPSRDYTGSFSTADHTLAMQFRHVTAQRDWTMNVASAALTWAETGATDLVVSAQAAAIAVDPPGGWTAVFQSTQPVPSNVLDPARGQLEVTVDVLGKPAKTTAPQTAMARVRLYWASSSQDFSGAEIPLAADSTGVFWNTRQLKLSVSGLPAAPASATHLRVSIDAPAAVDSQPNNNSTFLPLARFQARDVMGEAVDADSWLDLPEGSLLHPLDRQNPLNKVLAYQQDTALGATVVVYDDRGGFQYLPVDSEILRALAPGQTAQDVIRFLAVQNQTLIDEASYTVTVRGVNDPPWPMPDEAATGNYTDLRLSAAVLLSNDVDFDQGDRLSITSVDTASGWGAVVEAVWSEDRSEVREIIYRPAASAALRTLAPGHQLWDQFTYIVSDRFGGENVSAVNLVVTGEDKRLTIQPIPFQLATINQPLGPLEVVIEDPDGDPTDVQLSAWAYDGGLLPPESFQWSGDGAVRTLRISPTADSGGRTWVTVTATDAVGLTATQVFAVVVGSDDDSDLDGVPNNIEDAASHGGDMNQDGVPDRLQPHVVSWVPHAGTAYANLTVSQDAMLGAVQTQASPAASGIAADADFPWGLLTFQIDLAPGRATSQVVLRTDQPSQRFNRVFGFSDPEQGGQGWTYWMHRSGLGARVFANRVEMNFVDGGPGDVDQIVDQRVSASIALARVPQPWRNIVREDVDNDGWIVPLDVLLIINALLSRGSRTLGLFPTGSDSIPLFLDPSGSNSIEPQDVVIVINYLNEPSRALSAEREGAPFVGFAATLGRDQRWATLSGPTQKQRPQPIEEPTGSVVQSAPAVSAVDGQQARSADLQSAAIEPLTAWDPDLIFSSDWSPEHDRNLESM